MGEEDSSIPYQFNARRETCWICKKEIPAHEHITDEFGFSCHVACYGVEKKPT
ncbi:MAG: hypothetical protein WB919_04810 [Candidatus Sulfotelmatobacter sp.]